MVGPSQTADAFYNRGTAKIDRQDYLGAISEFTKAIEMNPRDVEAYNRRGEAKGVLKDHEGAMADFNKAKELNPTDAGF